MLACQRAGQRNGRRLQAVGILEGG